MRLEVMGEATPISKDFEVVKGSNRKPAIQEFEGT